MQVPAAQQSDIWTICKSDESMSNAFFISIPIPAFQSRYPTLPLDLNYV